MLFEWCLNDAGDSTWNFGSLSESLACNHRLIVSAFRSWKCLASKGLQRSKYEQHEKHISKEAHVFLISLGCWSFIVLENQSFPPTSPWVHRPAKGAFSRGSPGGELQGGFIQQPSLNIVKNWSIWVFPKIGVPQIGWFIMENPIKMDDLGVQPF